MKSWEHQPDEGLLGALGKSAWREGGWGGPGGSATAWQEAVAGGVGLCSPGTSDRTRANGLTLRQGRVRLGVREHSAPKGLAGAGTGCPGTGVSSSLGVFKNHVAVVLGDMVQWWPWQCWVNGWT